MLASPVLPSKNLIMSCHSSISEILRFLSSVLSFYYRHLSTVFSHLISNTWNTLTSREDYYGYCGKATLFCKMQLGLICETLSRVVLSHMCPVYSESQLPARVNDRGLKQKPARRPVSRCCLGQNEDRHVFLWIEILKSLQMDYV